MSLVSSRLPLLMDASVVSDSTAPKTRALRLSQESRALNGCMNALDELDHDQAVRVTMFLHQRYAFAKPTQPDVP
jgi:hypothetical protein